MKERPILFSSPMVRAILAGTKTQTRRVVKPAEMQRADDIEPHESYPGEWTPWIDGERRSTIECPYGQPGDRLYVKETWRIDDFDDAEIIYAADGDEEMMRETKGIIKWRPSIYMPRNRSRITLEIVVVRVERLNDISEQDAMAEGLRSVRGPFGLLMWEYSDTDGGQFSDPCVAYRCLWESINGPGSWECNPFVWVIEFRRVTP